MVYANPDSIVETEWVAEHGKDDNIQLVEVDYDPSAAYEVGHIDGAVLFDWKKDINDILRRNIVSQEGFERLLSRSGISNDSTVILYGDFNNWFAAYALWIFKLYGHNDVRIMNGGRKKWSEENRGYTEQIPICPQTVYTVHNPEPGLRARYDDVRNSLEKPDDVLVDVRSPAEYDGEVTAPPEYPTEHAQRGGHIPGAKNIPWASAVDQDTGTFKSIDELTRIYGDQGINKDKKITAYCRIGERSSHTWFVLKYLLGYPNVVNYDGSWTEWGNMIDNPLEK